MAISPISAASASANQNPAPSVASTGDNLDMNDFFELLSAQLQYQDPMQPTDNSEFMSQMAQFSSLQEMQTLAQTMNYSMASQTVGKSVLYSTTDAQGNTTSSSGTVEAVDVSSATPQCYINGAWVDYSKITTFYDASATPGSGSDGSSGDSSDPSGASNPT